MTDARAIVDILRDLPRWRAVAFVLVFVLVLLTATSTVLSLVAIARRRPISVRRAADFVSAGLFGLLALGIPTFSGAPLAFLLTIPLVSFGAFTAHCRAPHCPVCRERVHPLTRMRGAIQCAFCGQEFFFSGWFS